MRNKLKFKKLLNEYRSLKFELEFIEDVLSEYHLVFEETYRRYCAEKDIDLQELHEKNKERVEKIFPDNKLQKSESSTEPTQVTKSTQEKHKSIYRELAKKLHPDSLPEGDERYDEFKTAFQRATQAHNDGAWGDLFDLVERYGVNLRNYGSICNSLIKHIEQIKLQIDNQKKTFSWALYECEGTEDCEEQVIKNFLMTVFRFRQ
tara:strand:- start:21 stop:635 length:615 start_codon:yes stop_codon:yes gene_type:complete